MDQHLLNQILLDADPNRGRTAPSDEVMDKDVEMELVDIATAVSRNDLDEGSAEEELGDKGVGKADTGDEETGNSGAQDGSNLPASTVILVHGDLATKERIDGLRKMCTIEFESKGQLILALRLFHLKMVSIDAYWKVHMQPREGHKGHKHTAGFFNWL